MTPDDIDGAFVARVVPDLHVTELGPELVVVGGPSRVVSLNPTASLVFRFFDGDATLGELIDDFSEALDVDRAQVEADVLAFSQELGRNGLLVGVEADPIDDGRSSPAFRPGDDVSDLALGDLEGAVHPIAAHAGRRVLLVNWSPSCSFCLRIAGDLAALQDELGAQGVDLVLLAAGNGEVNRSLVEEVGLDMPVLLRDGTEADPFGGTGTPAALLLDTDGRVAEAMVIGANAVPGYARELAGGVLDAPGAEARGDVRSLPAPAAMCGQGGGATGNSTDWIGTRAYGIGGYHVGIRYDSDATASVLDRVFADARVDDERVPENYSVSLSSERDARTRRLDLLVRGGTQLVRSRSAERVVQGLLTYLAADVAPVDAALTRVNATVAFRGDEAFLLPPDLVSRLEHLQPHLTRAGLRLADVPYAAVDLARAEIVIPEPVVDVAPALLGELRVDTGAREPAAVAPGRHPIRAWYFAHSPVAVGRLSPATAVSAALPLVQELDDIPATVAGLVDLFGRIAGLGVWYADLGEMVEQIVASLD